MPTLISKKSIAILAIIFAGSGAFAAPAVDPSSLAQMNDVSILLPLAKTQAEFDSYLKASDQGVGGALVPQAIFDTFNVPGQTAIGPGRPELDYTKLRLVSIRLDPCFAQLGPINDPSSCQNQLRVIFQSLIFSKGITVAEDSALHVFYSLTRDQFMQAVEQIISLRKASGSSSDLGPLTMHPIVVDQGLSGAMASGIFALVKKYGGSGTITRMTRLYSTNDFWDFDGIDIAGGVAIPMIIPTLPHNSIVSEFTSPIAFGALHGTFIPETTAKDNMQVLVGDLQNVSAADQQAAFDSLLRIENPNLNSPNTIDCASCHVSQSVRVLNGPGLNLWPTGNPNAFVAPASIPSADLEVTTLGNPVGLKKNFHAFSYRGNQPMIAERVVNETAIIVDYLNSTIIH